MKLIDANTVVTIQVFNDVAGKINTKKMTVADAIDEWSDEGCPPTVDSIPIDWLLNKLLEYDLLETHHTICCLWERWKEENETNRCR